MMPRNEEKPGAKPKSGGRRRVWRGARTLLSLLVLLAVFHRPIIFRAAKYFAVRMAREQKLEIGFVMGGSIFTTLTVTNLRARLTEPGPVEGLEIGTLKLRYSLVGFMRKGLPGLLKDVDLREVSVVIDPAKAMARENPMKDQKGGKFPDLFPERLNVENVNFISRSQQRDTELSGLYFNFAPEKPGALKIHTLNLPSVRRWGGVTAGVTFRERNLVLSDLALGPEIVLTRSNLDVSKLDSNEIAVGIEGVCFGAPTSLAAKVMDLNETNRLKMRAESAGLPFDAIADYFKVKLPLHGVLTQFAFNFEGVPDKPAGWSGNIATRLNALAFEKQQLGAVSTTIDLGNGRAAAAASGELDPGNKVALKIELALPQKLDGFMETSVSGRLDLIASDLATLTKRLLQQARGDLSARADFKLNNGQFAADIAVVSAHLATVEAELSKLSFVIHLEKSISEQNQPVFANLVTNTRGSIESLRYAEYTTDGLSLALSNRGAAVTLEKLTLAKGNNLAALQGSYTLPDDLSSWERAPLAIEVEITAPDLSAFVVPGSATKLAGELTIRGSGQTVNRRHNGVFTIAGKAINMNGLTVRDLGGDVNIVNSVAHLPNFGVYLDAGNFLNLGAEMALDPSLKYSAWAEVRFDDLSAFQPLFATTGSKPQPLGGALAITWRGSGEMQPASHSGSATLELVRGKFGKQKNLAAHLTTDYSPERIDVPVLRAVADQGEVQTSVHWANQRLAVNDLTVRQRERTVLGGSIEIPLDLFAPHKTLDALVPADAPITATLRSKDVDLKILFEQLGQKPPLLGMLNAEISAEGSRKNLVANASIRASRLQPAPQTGSPPLT